MARAYDETGSLRFSRAERARLVVAVVLSALLHLAIWGGYHAGDRLGWWQRWQLPAWAHLGFKPQAAHAQTAQNEQPTMFVDVSHADADAPQAAKFYSNKNSRAANPEVANANIPKIEGKQSDYMKTEEASRFKKAASSERDDKDAPAGVATKGSQEGREADNREFTKLQPSVPPPAPMEQPESQAVPQTPGETDLRPKPMAPNASQAMSPTAKPASLQPSRPRTLKEALAQREQIPGHQTRQDGGVARHQLWSSLDVNNTTFGDYDKAVIDAIRERWYALLYSGRFTLDRTGKVTLHFIMKSDGSVIEMQMVDNTVGELLGYLCQEAIEEAAPFAKWPPDMVRLFGTNSRPVTFTFDYD